MDKIIIDYVKYGIYDNTLYFPNNKKSIEAYSTELSPLKKLLKEKNRSDVLITLKNENPNIFTLSFILSSIGLCDSSYEMIKKTIKTPVQAYIFVIFAYCGKVISKKQIQKFYEDFDLGDYIYEAFSMFSPNLKTKSAIKTKRHWIAKIKNAISTGTFSEKLIKEIVNNKIHYNELSPFLSYKFEVKDKDRLVNYFIGKYGVLEIITKIDDWYIEGASSELLKLLDSSLQNINDSEEIFKLLVIEKNIQNKNIKSLIIDAVKEKKTVYQRYFNHD